MKIVFMMFLAVMLISGMVSASPLTDYTAGQTAIDFNWRPNLNLDYTDSSATVGLDSSGGNYDLGVTVGLGKKFAFQYANQHVKSNINNIIAGGPNYTDLTANHFNLLYQLDKNVAVFAGYARAANDIVALPPLPSMTVEGRTASSCQFGVVGSFPLGKKLTAYGIAGFGPHIDSLEAGLGYDFTKNTELNVFYKSVKYKELEYNTIPDYKIDIKARGMGLGLTFKF